jgi:hypothetical protein
MTHPSAAVMWSLLGPYELITAEISLINSFISSLSDTASCCEWVGLDNSKLVPTDGIYVVRPYVCPITLRAWNIEGFASCDPGVTAS